MGINFWVVVLLLRLKIVVGDKFLNVTNLESSKTGIEAAVVQNAFRQTQNTYKLEDFFWTGSGDGPNTEDEGDYTTILTTKTVFVTSTAYTSPSTPTACQSCDTTSTTTTTENALTPDHDLDADKEFWLLTVLKSDGKDPDIMELRKNLASLYRKAFLRQQARHLGIKPRIKREDKPINVYIHKIDRRPINGEDKIEVVYHVAVSGQPVDAVTAAEDMRLVTDSEVKEELGFPFLVKAEPYIKPTVAQELAEVKSTWLFVSISLIILILLILGVILIAFCVTKRQSEDEVSHRVFGDREGRDNEAYQKDTIDGKGYSSGRRNQNPSPTYINFRTQASNETLTSLRPNSGLSSSTLSSNGSVDISPLMSVGKTTRKIQRPKAAVNKTVPLNVAPSVMSSSSSSSTLSDAFFVGNKDPGVISPKSYLSMPSVKAFPKSNNPEPLNKVLEPLSVHHLDMHDDPEDFTITRHGSLGASEDPGVIGPVVWNLHKHRMQRGASLDDGDIEDDQTNVSKMRKRFHELLDDTFSLFGSRRESPLHRPIQVKSHSAIDRSADLKLEYQRPKTSEPRRTTEAPKGAWMSTAPSPLVRPISAPFDRPYTAPRINRELILVNGVLRENDPAIPLIEEIKKEIDKCSMPNFDKPGSSRNN